MNLVLLLICSILLITTRAAVTYFTASEFPQRFTDGSDPGALYSIGVNNTWIITASSADKAVALNFTRFYTEGSFDYVRVYNDAGVLEYSLSGFEPARTRSYTTVTPGAYVRVKFTTDYSVVYPGFECEYFEVPVVQSTSWTIANPNRLQVATVTYAAWTSISYPTTWNQYQNDDNYTFRLYSSRESSTTGIMVNFTFFRTQQDNDVVKVFNDRNQLVDTFSGHSPARLMNYSIVYPGYFITIRFESDGSGVDSGFVLSAKSLRATSSIPYDVVKAVTPSGQYPMRLTASTTRSSFTDGYSPQSVYANSISREWTIYTSSTGRGVVLNFTRFATEGSYDTVRLYDSSNVLRYTFSGIEPASLKTYSYVFPTLVKVLFTTDGSSTYQGFECEYYEIPITSTAPYTITNVKQRTYAYAYTNSWSSYSYPISGSQFSNNLDYTIRIYNSIQTNGSIVLNFTRFDTESNCDFLRLYSANGSLIDSFTGPNPARINWNSLIIPGTFVTLVFTSDSSVESSGFTVYVKAIVALSPFVIDSPKVVINNGSTPGMSVNYHLNATSIVKQFSDKPLSYARYAGQSNTSWRIHAPATTGFAIVLNFTRFYTEANYDFVRIYDSSDTLRYTFSGLEPAEVKAYSYVIPGPYVTVVFSTDLGTEYYGFDCDYRAVLSSTTVVQTYVNPNRGYYASAGYNWYSVAHPLNGGSYANFDNYTIRLYGSNNYNAIILNFTRFSTESNYDYLRIYNDRNALVDSLSGSGLARLANYALVYPGSYITLVFTSDRSVVSQGFQFYFKGIVTSRTSNYDELKVSSSTTGSVVATNSWTSNATYNSSYPSSARDSWTIAVDSTIPSYSCNAIALEIPNFYTEARYDYLKVYDDSGAQVSAFHGSYPRGFLTRIIIPGRMIRMSFTSDGSAQHAGFTYKYMCTHTYSSTVAYQIRPDIDFPAFYSQQIGMEHTYAEVTSSWEEYSINAGRPSLMDVESDGSPVYLRFGVASGVAVVLDQYYNIIEIIDLDQANNEIPVHHQSFYIYTEQLSSSTVVEITNDNTRTGVILAIVLPIVFVIIGVIIVVVVVRRRRRRRALANTSRASVAPSTREQSIREQSPSVELTTKQESPEVPRLPQVSIPIMYPISCQPGMIFSAPVSQQPMPQPMVQPLGQPLGQPIQFNTQFTQPYPMFNVPYNNPNALPPLGLPFQVQPQMGFYGYQQGQVYVPSASKEHYAPGTVPM